MGIRRIIGIGVFISIVVVLAFLIWVEVTSPSDTRPIYMLPVVVGAVVGLVLLIRVPANNIGVLLLVAVLAMTGLGAGDVVMEWADTNGLPTLAIVASLVNDMSWGALMVSVFVLLPIWFPDGRAINRWSKWVARAAVTLTVVAMAGFWFAEAVCVDWPGDECLRYESNPWGIAGWDGTLLEPLLLFGLLLSVPAITSAILRFRRSEGVVRQQLKWFVFAASVLVVGVLTSLVWAPPQVVSDVIAVVLYSGLWLSIGLAVLKYRLYDLDRIISRTVTYASVVVLIGALYVAMVTVLTSLVPTQDSLAVAASTLAAAAVFNPARKRFQHWADRRFNRTAYRADSISTSFARSLGESLTAEQLASLLAQTTSESLQPERLGIWINAEGDVARSS